RSADRRVGHQERARATAGAARNGHPRLPPRRARPLSPAAQGARRRRRAPAESACDPGDKATSMTRKAEIVIVGGGLAGASAAVMLGRTDHRIVLIDLNEAPRPDFRCEKLGPAQTGLLHRMGLAGFVLPFATHSP